MAATSEKCRKCKPTYVRTPETRLKMSRATAGKPKPWLKGRKRLKVGKKIAEWWTDERREAKRQDILAARPGTRPHKLSSKARAEIREAAGKCSECDHDGSVSRLDVHHVDRDDRNQDPSNLVVLCHRCHMKEHAEAKETGWDSYHRKRRQAAET
jgi:hypothetical protein